VARITSKYQLTLPKAVAECAGLKPGDDIECEAIGDLVRVTLKRRFRAQGSVTDKLVLFDVASERIRHRYQADRSPAEEHRGWTRNELHER
jgi:AbrB family looped-hinge helix DNA binding protein